LKRIKFGLSPWLSSDLAFYREWVLECEDLGFHSIYVTDHLAGGLECWTKLSALSTITRRVRLGTVVLCNPLRNPALLANMAASVDIISGGRLELGLGAGHVKWDFDICGIPFPKPSVRIGQMEEAIKIVKMMWAGQNPRFQGKYYEIEEARCPKPIQQPHPPIMVGGEGEKLTLKVVAKHANMCNLPHTTVEQTNRKLEVLREHCGRVGRDPREIENSWFGIALVSDKSKELDEGMETLHRLAPDRYPNPENTRARTITGTPEQCINKISEYVEAGITYFILYFPDRKGVRLFSREIMPKVVTL